MPLPAINASVRPQELDVLVIDDDEWVCARLTKLLKSDHKSTMSVGSLAEARRVLHRYRFKLLIIDRRLGDGDGIDLCCEFRALPNNEATSILVLSALDNEEYIVEALTAGADECISKHSSATMFLDAVRALLNKSPRHSTPRAQSVDGDQERIDTLHSYDVLDTGAESIYDDITLLATRICGTPIALVSLVAGDRQWFKSKVGLDAEETPIEHAFCAQVIKVADQGLFTVNDARTDARFADNPYVTGSPKVRFYAGAPLVSPEGHALGTLCVIDQEPRTLDPQQEEALLALSRQVMALLEERRTSAALKSALVAQEKMADELKRSEALFREAYENAPIGKALVSPEGRWLRVNPALCDIVGYTPDELMKTTFQALTHPDDLDQDLRQVAQMLAGEIRTYQMEKRYIHKAGHLVWVQLNVSLVWENATPLYFVSQIQDITERKNADHLKAEFLAMISHELRTPVTAIRGALGLLAANRFGELPSKVQSMVAMADRNSDRLHRLVNDILDMEKIDCGAFVYEKHDVDMNTLVSQAASDLQPYADQYNVVITPVFGATTLITHADPNRLMQVLANLISNAIKFSPPGGKVEVRTERLLDSLRVSVADHGAGIPEEFQRYIFHKFAQADFTATNKKGGSGLGLNISRKIVEQHGGNLAFRSIAGTGTTFYFDLTLNTG